GRDADLDDAPVHRGADLVNSPVGLEARETPGVFLAGPGHRHAAGDPAGDDVHALAAAGDPARAELPPIREEEGEAAIRQLDGVDLFRAARLPEDPAARAAAFEDELLGTLAAGTQIEDLSAHQQGTEKRCGAASRARRGRRKGPAAKALPLRIGEERGRGRRPRAAATPCGGWPFARDTLRART